MIKSFLAYSQMKINAFFAMVLNTGLYFASVEFLDQLNHILQLITNVIQLIIGIISLLILLGRKISLPFKKSKKQK